jgi:hypothetical protein
MRADVAARRFLAAQLRADAPGASQALKEEARAGIRRALAREMEVSDRRWREPMPFGDTTARSRRWRVSLGTAAAMTLLVGGAAALRSPVRGNSGDAVKAVGPAGPNVEIALRDSLRRVLLMDRAQPIEISDPLAKEVKAITAEAKGLARLALACLPSMPPPASHGGS